MFQFGKLAIQSTEFPPWERRQSRRRPLTVIFENVNGIASNRLWESDLMTVAGQAFGAGRKEEAKYYIIKLTRIWQRSCLIISCAADIRLVSRPIMHLAGMEAGKHANSAMRC